MSHPLLENSPQVSLVQRNQEIQTLAADSADEAFAESVRLRRVERRLQDAQAHRLQCQIELRGVNFVAVVDQKPVRILSRDGLPELLERPACRQDRTLAASLGGMKYGRTELLRTTTVMAHAWEKQTCLLLA